MSRSLLVFGLIGTVVMGGVLIAEGLRNGETRIDSWLILGLCVICLIMYFLGRFSGRRPRA